MTRLDELRLINESTRRYLKTINKDYSKNEILKNILEDDACFFKMNKEEAYRILNYLGIIEDQIDTTYKTLISYDEFYKLYKDKKIDLNDKEIVIKYPIYRQEDLFKDKKYDKIDVTSQPL